MLLPVTSVPYTYIPLLPSLHIFIKKKLLDGILHLMMVHVGV